MSLTSAMNQPEPNDNLFNRPAYDPGFVYEDRFYMADPETDVLLFDGSQLKNGMLVMIAEPTVRAKTPLNPAQHGAHDRFEAVLYQAKVFNRWCYVSDLRIDDEPVDGHWCRKRRVAFIGTYEDGVQVKHDLDINHAWIVKKSSMIRHNLETLLDLGVITQEEFVRIAREELGIDVGTPDENFERLSRDDRVRAYWLLPESERATYAVIRDYRGDILALEPDAVVAKDNPDGQAHIYTARALRDLGWDNVAAVVMGSDCELRKRVVGWFLDGETPSEVSCRVNTWLEDSK